MKQFAVVLVVSVLLTVASAKPTTFSNDFSLMSGSPRADYLETVKCIMNVEETQSTKSDFTEQLWRELKPKLNDAVETYIKCINLENDALINSCVKVPVKAISDAIADFDKTQVKLLSADDYKTVMTEIAKCDRSSSAPPPPEKAADTEAMRKLDCYINLEDKLSIDYRYEELWAEQKFKAYLIQKKLKKCQEQKGEKAVAECEQKQLDAIVAVGTELDIKLFKVLLHDDYLAIEAKFLKTCNFIPPKPPTEDIDFKVVQCVLTLAEELSKKYHYEKEWESKKQQVYDKVDKYQVCYKEIDYDVVDTCKDTQLHELKDLEKELVQQLKSVLSSEDYSEFERKLVTCNPDSSPPTETTPSPHKDDSSAFQATAAGGVIYLGIYFCILALSIVQ